MGLDPNWPKSSPTFSYEDKSGSYTVEGQKERYNLRL
jgi:hypothetical protein